MQRSEPLPDHQESADRWSTRPAFSGSQVFINDLEFTCELSEDGALMESEIHAVDAMRAPGAGAVRPSILATIADVLAGIQANHTIAGRLPLTLDIEVRTTRPMGEWVRASSRLLKVGRTTVAGEVSFSDPASGAVVALSYVTFIESPRPQDLSPNATTIMRTTGTLTRPFPDHVGARIVEPGVVEIDHRPFVLQNSGTLQGGVVALLGEYAAESLTGRPVVDLDVRYLSTVRVGPARATARAVAPDLMRVEIRDEGKAGRLAARSMARLAPRETSANGGTT